MSAYQQPMQMSVYTVKNTFLTLKKQEDSVPRSSSVPRAFKPGQSKCDDFFHSDDSTNASDKDISENFGSTCSETNSQDVADCTDCQSVCTDDGGDFAFPCAKSCWSDMTDDEPAEASPFCLADLVPCQPCLPSKVTLSLVDTVASVEATQTRSKLRPTAKLFKSTRAPTAEVETVISSAVAALSGQGIVGVQVQDGGMGGTTTICGSLAYPQLNVKSILSIVQDTLLNSAEQSENTYILGYGAKAFNSLDESTISCRISTVPDAQKDTCCWDIYEKGFCAQCSSCQWSHPAAADIMRVIVMIK